MTQGATWPTDRFYWAVIESPTWRGRGQLPPGLLPLLGEVCPEPEANLHAVCQPFDEHRLLVCAARRNELGSIDDLSLTPAQLPAFLESDADPRSFELLVGEFEPKSIRRARRRRRVLVLSTVVAASSLISIGLHRRAAYWHDAADEAGQAALTRLQTAVPGALTADALDRELARQRALHQVVATIPSATAAEALEDLLRTWPSSANGEPQSLRAEPNQITATIDSAADASSFLRELHAPAGWALDEPTITSAHGGTRINLRYRRTGGGR